MKHVNKTLHIHKTKPNVIKTIFLTLIILITISVVGSGLILLMKLAAPKDTVVDAVRPVQSRNPIEIVPWSPTQTPSPTPSLVPGKVYTFETENIGLTLNYTSRHGIPEEHFASNWKGGSYIEGEDMWSVRFQTESRDKRVTHTLYAATPNYVPEDWEAVQMWLNTALESSMSINTVTNILEENYHNPLSVEKVVSDKGVSAFEMWGRWCTFDCTLYRTYIIPYNREGYASVFLYTDIERIPEANLNISIEEQEAFVKSNLQTIKSNMMDPETASIIADQDFLFNSLTIN